MKTGRAMLLQILTNGESQAIQFTMRSHRSLNSEQFASAKPVIDICQRERVVHVSSEAAGSWRKAEGQRLKPKIEHMPVRHQMTRPLIRSSLDLFMLSSWLWSVVVPF